MEKIKAEAIKMALSVSRDIYGDSISAREDGMGLKATSVYKMTQQQSIQEQKVTEADLWRII